MPEAVAPDAHPLETMLAVSDLIQHRQYAEIYARVLELGTPTVGEIATEIDSSETTVYESVNALVKLGVLERVTEVQPHRYRARDIELTVQAGEEYEISPTLFVALARTESNENLQLYLDRHGRSGFARAVEFARAYVRGRTTARVMAREEGIPVLEAETVLQELRESIVAVEPELEGDLDVDELDAVVDDQSAE